MTWDNNLATILAGRRTLIFCSVVWTCTHTHADNGAGPMIHRCALYDTHTDDHHGVHRCLCGEQRP